MVLALPSALPMLEEGLEEEETESSMVRAGVWVRASALLPTDAEPELEAEVEAMARFAAERLARLARSARFTALARLTLDIVKVFL